jgi:hypothetical protein
LTIIAKQKKLLSFPWKTGNNNDRKGSEDKMVLFDD